MLDVILVVLTAVVAALVVFLRKRGDSHYTRHGWSPADQRILITGASSGMGEAFAIRCAQRGCRGLALTARNGANLERVAELCRRFGGVNLKVITIAGDCGDEKVCREAVEKAEAAFGGLDTLVVNAGISHSGLFEDTRDEDLAVIRNIVNVNVMQGFYLVHFAKRLLLRDDAALGMGKKILFVSSVAGFVGSPGRSVYSPTKAAVNIFAEALNAELRMRYPKPHLSCTVVCPGPVETHINDTRQNFGGGESVSIPFPPGTLTAEGAAEKMESALARNVRCEGWLPGANAIPFLRAFLPGLLESLSIKTAKDLLSTSEDKKRS